MMPTLQLSAPAMAQDVPAVQGGAASLTDIALPGALFRARRAPAAGDSVPARLAESDRAPAHLAIGGREWGRHPSDTLRLCAMSGAPM